MWPIVQNQCNALKKSYEGLKSEEAKKKKEKQKNKQKYRIVCTAHTEMIWNYPLSLKHMETLPCTTTHCTNCMIVLVNILKGSIGCRSMTMTNVGFNLFNFQQAFLHIIAATGIWSQHYTWNWFEVWKFWHWAKWGQFSNLFFYL